MGAKARARLGATRVTFLSVRCSPGFKAWLLSFAEAERSTPTQLVEQALATLAGAREFPAAPPR